MKMIKWLFSLIICVLISNPALALNQSFFELDKDLTNNVVSVHQATLKSKVTTSATSFIVCQLATTPATPFTILIDAEQMTVNSTIAATASGNCSNARTYNVTRGANGTVLATHAGASDVTFLMTGSFAGNDWDQVYNEVTNNLDPTCSALGAIACNWLHDNNGETVFTTKNSRDDLDISSWSHANSSASPADEILDTYAIRYSDHLFFGIDRWTVNGAEDFGIWFFQDLVTAESDGTFSGVHTDGDILILGSFTKGGTGTSVTIYKWDSNVAGNLIQIGTGGDCVPGAVSDPACATVNNTTIVSPWPYQGKASGSAANVIYSGGMVEGGLNLTPFALAGQCFQSFLAETRSSSATNATLKDFVLGTFQTCP